MHIAVLGSGNMGGTLGRLFAGAGHTVAFSYSRDPEKLERLARVAGRRACAASPADAVADADVVLLTVLWAQASSALRSAGDLRGKILVDVTNPLTPSDDALAIGHKRSGAEVVAQRAHGAKVVKAFNTVPVELLRAGANVLAEQPEVCFCGDDAGAKRVVARLIRDIGFSPVDCGALASSRYLEPLAMLVGELAYNQGKSPKVGVRFLRPSATQRTKRTRSR